MIKLTEMAQEKLAEYLKAQPDCKYVRLGIQGGGCSGFSYSIGLLAESDPDWLMFEFNKITVVVDPLSLMYLENITLDYVDGVMESGFKFTNPLVKSTCGCGQSFSV
jgi:iron-sulfur cluster assembly protein